MLPRDFIPIGFTFDQPMSIGASPLRARRALIEAAWAYRHPAKVSAHIQQRIDHLPKPLRNC